MSNNTLLTIKELAADLKRSRRYVHAMRRRGFPMPGGRAYLKDALEWLEKNPQPCSRCTPLHTTAHRCTV